MKINSINSCYNFNKNIKTQSFRVKSPLQNDVFVKSSNIAFGANDKFARKFIPYKKEITDYILNSPQITLDGIEKILTKYSPDTKVVERDLNDKSIPEYFIAFAQRPIELSLNGMKFCARERNPKKIHILLPENDTKEQRIKLLSALIHESTHIFQNESTDRTSMVDKYNAVFNNAKNFSQMFNTARSQLMTAGFYNLEAILTQTLAQNTKYDLDEPELINTTPEKFIKETIKNATGLQIDSYIRKIINTMIDSSEKQLGEKIDRKALLEIFAFKASLEKEAYQNGANIVKEVENINGATALDAKATMYDYIIQTSNSMRKQLK